MMKLNHLLLMVAFPLIVLLSKADERRQVRTTGTQVDKNIYEYGGIVQTDPSKKQITLIFTAADKADGADIIIGTLKKHKIQGAFFFTGDFFNLFPEVVQRLKTEKHYIGAHSFSHPLYCAWEDRNQTLITREEFTKDLLANYAQLEQAGIRFTDAPLFVPPYEYYNDEISAWTRSLGIQLMNFTAGTITNADYTTPDMKNYRSSQEIYDKVMSVEKQKGLNGHIMLVHFGTDDRRTDKFYGYLDEMIKVLKKKGYSFVPLRQAVGI